MSRIAFSCCVVAFSMDAAVIFSSRTRTASHTSPKARTLLDPTLIFLPIQSPVKLAPVTLAIMSAFVRFRIRGSSVSSKMMVSLLSVPLSFVLTSCSSTSLMVRIWSPSLNDQPPR